MTEQPTNPSPTTEPTVTPAAPPSPDIRAILNTKLSQVNAERDKLASMIATHAKTLERDRRMTEAQYRFSSRQDEVDDGNATLSEMDGAIQILQTMLKELEKDTANNTPQPPPSNPQQTPNPNRRRDHRRRR